MRRVALRIKTILMFGALVGALGIVALGFGGSAGTAQNLPRDCEQTSIIYCGSLTLDELKADYNSNDNGRYSDIPAVFNHFGISSADINGLNSSNHKRGIVKADNTVWLDGKLIGINAVTAGRANKPGSTVIPGTGAFKRSPSVSFARPSTQIDAFIGFENGQPAWGILSSCGNPVTWESPPKPPAPEKPKLDIEKKVRAAENQSWTETETIPNNSTLTYRIEVRNTGKAADTNVLVKDMLPSNHTFVDGSVRVDGQTKQGSDSLVSSGMRLDRVDAGATVAITFQAKVMVPATKCGDTTFTNKATVESEQSPAKEDTSGGKVRVACAEIKCVSLTASALSVEQGGSVTFTARADLDNATLQSYEFRVNDEIVQNTTSNTFTYNASQEGAFRVKVTVKTDRGDVTNTDCMERITVQQKPVCPHNPALPPDHPDCEPPEPQVQGATTMPKTGAAGLAGIFAATSLSGAALHHLVSRRRNSE